MTTVDAEAWVLTTAEGLSLLSEVSATAVPGPSDLERWRRKATPEQVSAAIRIAATRSRGAAKFSRAQRMWFDPVGLEQATAEPVARHKALRFSESLVVDLCCGIGGDAIALAHAAEVVAVDADHGMCRRTVWNAGVFGVGERLQPIQSLAERFAFPTGAMIHIDPDRRVQTQRRARGLADYAPGFDFLQSLPHRVAGGAIKLGPASDFEVHFGSGPFEIEVVSLKGECKEATVWFGSLRTCGRRATVLPDSATWTDRDGPRVIRRVSAPVSHWIYDPDPALIRAGLLDSFAAVHDLRRCAGDVAFLTGKDYVASPFLAAFEVVDVLPLDLKTIRRRVAERGVGMLEIKTRGVDLRPETLRTRLNSDGPSSATLLLWAGAGPSCAVLARRVANASSQNGRALAGADDPRR